ncbi:MAG: XdhC family protein [Proteobacteria bacterium]|nr:XdhC family protein [Pseudomonadota bacterium]
MKDLISDILEHLNRNEAVGIATIVAHEGSSPRSTGARMVIHEDGTTLGSIGGGSMEARVQEEARGLFQNQREPGLLFYDLTPADLDSMGMTCGGRVEILLDLVLPTPENIEAFSQWQAVLKKSQDGFFLTRIPNQPTALEKTLRCLLAPDGTIPNIFSLSQAAANLIRETTATLKTPGVIDVEDALIMLEPPIMPTTLHIFGAGHVAVPTAEFAARVGFEVLVLDDREEFATPDRFPSPMETRVIQNFDEAFSGIAPEPNDFIVIVTRGHLHDKTVLARALNTQAGYIGMIGSRKKRDGIYEELLTEGFTRQDLDRVHCPIGMAIGAETPEEIAVSIVAELIRIRADLAS